MAGKSRHFSEVFLGVLALGLIAASYCSGQGESFKIALLSGGVLLAVIAAFYARIEGILKFWKAEIPIKAAVLRAEEQVESGQTVAASEMPELVQKLEEMLSTYGSRVGTPTVTKSPAETQTVSGGDGDRDVQNSEKQRTGRNVVLVDDAVLSMTTLPQAEQYRVHTAIARMSHPDFEPTSDPKTFVPGDRERTYRTHRLAGSDIRLLYRQSSEDDSSTLFIVLLTRLQLRNED